MGSKLVEVGSTLDVSSEDVRDLQKQRRRGTLAGIARYVAPVTSVILGILAAEEVYPIGPRVYDSYPFAAGSLVLSSSRRANGGRRAWIGVLILSIALFAVSFLSVALYNTAANDNYGASPRYGVFCVSGSHGG